MSQDFWHQYQLFINTPTFDSQGFVILRSISDQKPLVSEDEISQGLKCPINTK